MGQPQAKLALEDGTVFTGRSFGASGEQPGLYPAGSWGPTESDALLESDGRKWRRP